MVTENFCSGTAMLHVNVYEKIMKDKAEFQLDLTEQLPKTVYLPDHSTSGDAITMLQTLWYAHERKSTLLHFARAALQKETDVK
jgi:hypothetical protein